MTPYYPTECPYCQRLVHTVKKERRNTSYVDDESNWITACQECRDEDDAIMADMWADYWSDRI